MTSTIPSSKMLGRRRTIALAFGIAVASWVAMALVLGYGGMQHAVSLSGNQLVEVIPGFLAGGAVAGVMSWLACLGSRPRPRVPFLILALLLFDVAAAFGAVIVFHDIPFELFALVVLAATGGGAQLIGAALGVLAQGGNRQPA